MKKNKEKETEGEHQTDRMKRMIEKKKQNTTCMNLKIVKVSINLCLH